MSGSAVRAWDAQLNLGGVIVLSALSARQPRQEIDFRTRR